MILYRKQLIHLNVVHILSKELIFITICVIGKIRPTIFTVSCKSFFLDFLDDFNHVEQLGGLDGPMYILKMYVHQIHPFILYYICLFYWTGNNNSIGKWFERCIHEQIQNWCQMQSIFTDEQSGFRPNRRLQTRILSICKDIRLTIAACNHPALVIFIDFLSAFDCMWYPKLITNLPELNMSLPLVKWIYQWLRGYIMVTIYGEK